MVMRSIAMLGILLLAGCASRQVVTLDTPLCPGDKSNKSLTAVRIEIDANAKKVNPKECYVSAGTEVVWWEANGKAFEAQFKLKSPARWGKMHFDSKPVGSHHEASFDAHNEGK